MPVKLSSLEMIGKNLSLEKMLCYTVIPITENTHKIQCSDLQSHQLYTLPENESTVTQPVSTQQVYINKRFLNSSKVITGGSVHWTYSSSCSSAILALEA